MISCFKGQYRLLKLWLYIHLNNYAYVNSSWWRLLKECNTGCDFFTLTKFLILETSFLLFWVQVFLAAISFFFAFYLGSQWIHSTVIYDRKPLIINGQRRIPFSGSIHYPRSTLDASCFFPNFFCLLKLIVYDVSHSTGVRRITAD